MGRMLSSTRPETLTRQYSLAGDAAAGSAWGECRAARGLKHEPGCVPWQVLPLQVLLLQGVEGARGLKHEPGRIPSQVLPLQVLLLQGVEEARGLKREPNRIPSQGLLPQDLPLQGLQGPVA